MRLVIAFLISVSATVWAGPPLPRLKDTPTSKKVLLDGQSITEDSTNADHLHILKTTVRLVRQESDGFMPVCTGVVKSTQQILTAAHCFLGSPTHVEVFDPQAPNKKQRIAIAKHNATEVALEKPDLAVILLDKAVPASAEIATLADGMCDDDSELTIAGFGFSNGDVLPDDVRIDKRSRRFFETPEIMVTTGETKNPQVCMGDSGGPIFCHSKKKLVVKAISSHIYTLNRAIGKKKLEDYPSAEAFCRDRKRLSSTNLSVTGDVIEKLSQFPTSADKPSVASGTRK